MKWGTVVGPSYWASYLVNGDASGLTDEEKAHADHWRTLNGVLNVVDAEDPWFTKAYGLYDTLATVSRGEVCEYVCELA